MAEALVGTDKASAGKVGVEEFKNIGETVAFDEVENDDDDDDDDDDDEEDEDEDEDEREVDDEHHQSSKAIPTAKQATPKRTAKTTMDRLNRLLPHTYDAAKGSFRVLILVASQAHKFPLSTLALRRV